MPEDDEEGDAEQQRRQQQRTKTSKTGDYTFMGYHQKVLDKMPEFISTQLPFVSTAKGAIDTQLLQLLGLLAVSDVAFANLTNRLSELQHKQFYTHMLQYYSLAAAVKNRAEEEERRLRAGKSH